MSYGAPLAPAAPLRRVRARSTSIEGATNAAWFSRCQVFHLTLFDAPGGIENNLTLRRTHRLTESKAGTLSKFPTEATIHGALAAASAPAQ